MINEAFKILAHEVAILLTGLSDHRMRIVWKKPAIKDTIGAMRRSFNQLIIEIDPELEPDELIFTFLHEIAHANLHPDAVSTSASPVIGSAVQAFPVETIGGASPRSKRGDIRLKQSAIEDHADILTELWIGQAKRKGYDHSPFGILKSLKEIYKPGASGFNF